MTAAGATGRRGPGNAGELVIDPMPCPGCAYDLRGLQYGDPCPECGREIRRSRAYDDDKLGDAPRGYLATLQLGLLCMGFAGLGFMLMGILGMVGGLGVAALLGAGVGGLWILGVLIVLRKRQRSPAAAPRPGPEWVRLRQWVLATQIAFTVGLLLDSGALLLGAGWLSWIAQVFVIPGQLGWVPLCIYLSFLADWAGDSGLASRFRATGWALAVFGVIALLLRGLGMLTSSGVNFLEGLGFLALLMWFLVTLVYVFAQLVMVISILQMISMTSWAVTNSRREAERDARRLERARRRAEELVKPSVSAAVLASEGRLASDDDDLLLRSSLEPTVDAAPADEPEPDPEASLGRELDPYALEDDDPEPNR